MATNGIKETLGEYKEKCFPTGGWPCRLFAHTVLSVVSIKYARRVKLLDVLHQNFFALLIFCYDGPLLTFPRHNLLVLQISLHDKLPNEEKQSNIEVSFVDLFVSGI